MTKFLESQRTFFIARSVVPKIESIFKRNLPKLWLILLLLQNSGCQEIEPQSKFGYTFNSQKVTLDQRISKTIETPPNSFVEVKVQGQETEVSASIQSSNRVSSLPVTLNYFRLHPLFLTHQSGIDGDQLELLIDPIRKTASGSIDIQVSYYPVTSANKQLFDGYSLMSSALSVGSIPIEQRETDLIRAAKLLRKVGRNRDALWADFFRGYTIYMQAFDLTRSLQVTEELISKQEVKSDPVLHLAALQLLGAVLIERNPDDSSEIAVQKFHRSQQVLNEVIAKANEMNMPFEAAWALNNSGIGYYYQKDYPNAIAQYNAALELSEAVGDERVSRIIMTNRVFVEEISGLYFDAIASLERIGVGLRNDNDPMLLADNQRELGRLYREVADYRAAVEHLSKALQLYRKNGDHSGEGRTLLSQGIAEMQLGRYKLARNRFEFGLSLTEESGSGTDLRDLIRHLSYLERLDGNTERLIELRAKQDSMIDSETDRANFHHELALDLMSSGETIKAAQHLKNCISVMSGEADPSLAELCKLRYAHLQSKANPADVNIKDVRLSAQSLATKYPISWALTALQLLAEIEYQMGNLKKSLAVSSELVQKITTFRKELPGVMGAWYWESRNRILDFYFERVLESNLESDFGKFDNLAALINLQNLELAPSKLSEQNGNSSDEYRVHQELRQLIASTSRQGSEDEVILAQNRIDTLLMKFDGYGENDALLEPGEIQKLIDTIPEDTGVVTFYFGESQTIAWLLTSMGLRQYDLGLGGDIGLKIQEVREGFRIIGNELNQESRLDTLGEKLLGPLESELPENLFVVTTGPLTGFPVDALRIRGKFLAEVLHVAHLSNLSKFGGDSVLEPGSKVYSRAILAGAPTLINPKTLELTASENEIRQIADILKPSNVTMLTGESLNYSALEMAFESSPDIIHIASHAVVDMQYPELSQIQLSQEMVTSNGDSNSESFLMPRDIYRQNLKGSLVVLSACETAGVQRFAFDNNLGFVSEFFKSGAKTVIASLWPVGDQDTSEFMTFFYQQLVAGFSPVKALSLTKRHILKEVGLGGFTQWAAFQAYQN